MKRQIFKYAPIFKARRSYYSYVSHQGNCSVKWQKECLKKQDIKPLQIDLKWNCSSANRRKPKQTAIALVFTIRQTPNYVHHQFLFWDCKLTRVLNKKFLGHLRWKKYSSAVSTCPKNFVCKRDLVMGRQASKWEWAGEGTIFSLVLSPFSLKKAYFEIWKKKKVLNSLTVYCEKNFERYK